MTALLAGFIAGYAMGLLSLAFIATHLPTLLRLSGPLHARFPPRTSLPLLIVAVTLLSQVLWGLVGLGLGALYWALRADASGGLGSPSLGFTAAMLVAGAIFLALLWALTPTGWRRAAPAAAIFVGLFGWLLPHLAEA